MKTIYHVVDCEFNRAWYTSIIGLYFDSPPAYAKVEIIETNWSAMNYMDSLRFTEQQEALERYASMVS